VAGLGQHLDQRTGDALLALDRLVGIGIDAECQWRRSMAGTRELGAEQFSGVGLGEQAGFEVEPGGEVEIAVAGPREAVGATVLAATVRIDRLLEPDVWRIVAADDAARGGPSGSPAGSKPPVQPSSSASTSRRAKRPSVLMRAPRPLIDALIGALCAAG
jgi:hypothetical protein